MKLSDNLRAKTHASDFFNSNMPDAEDSDKGISTARESLLKSQNNAREHVKQLQRLQEKDPEFYQYLKEHDNELLEFNDEDICNDAGSVLQDDVDSKPTTEELQKPLAIVITTTKVDSWCSAIKQQRSLGAVKSMLHAFRLACHHGDDAENGSGKKIAILSSSVFNKIMVFVLNEMDEILRKLLGAPSSGGKKESILDLMTTKKWKSRGSLMRLYLGNTLHILTEMTDEQMISFTLKRIKASAVFLAAFPILLRKYIKVVLHAWGTGIGALPVVSFLFLRDLCVQLGSDCLERCLKGVYKAYVMNCKLPKHISRSKQQHINFLGNCVSELYGLDPISAYQHAFVSIRQLAVVLRGSINERGSKTVKGKGKGKIQQGSSKASKKQAEKTYQKVYDWQFIFCLELWTKVICAFNSEAYFGPLAYPLTQIISGVAIFVPTARYCPLRLRCIRMLNRLAGATSTFIPVSTLLLDMLDMKELNGPPTGGVGKAIDMHGIKQLDKITLKTRAFQEACIYSVVQELAEHLAHWSYSIAFFELSFISLVRLRNCCKSIKGDRFRREIRELISQVEANCEFTNLRRIGICFGPSDPAAASFLEAEKESKSSPLMEFVANLSLRVQQRAGSIAESRVLVGAESSVFSSKFSEMDQEESGDLQEEGEAVFNSSWMPEKKSKATKSKLKTLKHDKKEPNAEEVEEDVVEDLILSSDEGEDEDDIDNGGDNDIHSNDDGVVLIDPTDESKEDLESHQSKTRQSKKRKIRQVRTHNNKKEKSRANLKKGAWLPKTTVRNGPN